MQPEQRPSGSVTHGPCNTPQERHQLFEELRLVYTPVLKFADECQALAQVSSQDDSGYQGHEKEYDALTLQYGPKIARSYVAPVSIHYISEKIGYGVAANKDLKPRDFIATYTG